MKNVTTLLSICTASVLILSGTGCGVTDPFISIDFPFFFLQDISTSNIPYSCCYLKESRDGIAASDSLYFVDYEYGYCLARVDLQGYAIEDVGATAEGGYALALCGNLLFYVSNSTYVVHSPVVLSSYGRFILTDPTGSSWHLYSVGANGTITTINSQSWDVTAIDVVSGLQDPVAAAITSDGTAIFIADGNDNTIKKISTDDFSTVTAECIVPGGINDLYAGPGNLIYAAPDSLNAIWGIDTGTGQHYSTYPISSPALSVAVTPDDHYIYVGYKSSGVSVINAQNNDVEATSTSYGTVYDIAINGNGKRAMLCSNLAKIFTLEK
jgi:DNA-binding beta-propeller fold protein YncE